MRLNKLKIFIIGFIIACFCLAGCNINYLAKDTAVYENTIKYNYSSENAVEYGSLVEMLDNVRPSVYEVYAKISGEQSISCGSGTIIGEYKDSLNRQNYIFLTCHHVIDEKTKVLIKDIYGNVFQINLIGGDPSSDIAIYSFCPELNGYTKIENKEHTYKINDNELKIVIAKLRDFSTAKLKIGESCYAIGNPLGTLGGTVTSGIVSALDREVLVENKKMTLIQTDCAINSGNSGGALFDNGGNLIGVVNAGYTGGIQGLNFAIPIDKAMQTVSKLSTTYTNLNYGYVEGNAKVASNYGTLFQGNDISLVDSSYSEWNTNTYVRINGLSNYYKDCGLAVGDEVLSATITSNSEINTHVVSDTSIVYNGEVLTPSKQLVKFLKDKDLKIGDTVSFSVKKYLTGEKKTINITLKQYIYANTGK